MTDGLKATAERVETSVELGQRAARRAERRMLIGGHLVEAASGAEFDNVTGTLIFRYTFRPIEYWTR